MDFNLSKERNELIAQLKQKNAAVIASLFDSYGPALYTVVLQIVRDEERTNDVFRHVFVQLVKQVDSYNPQSESLFIWMYKIARNKSLEAIRSSGTGDKAAAENEQKARERIAILEVDNYGLKKLIAKLNEEHKILLDLCYYRGYTHDEIGKTLNIPVETVKSKIQIAVLELRVLF